MHGAGFAEPRGLEVLRHGIGRRQPDDPMPGRFVCLADHAQRIALAGAGPPLDQFQSAGIDRMHKRALLVRAQPTLLAKIEGHRRRHRQPRACRRGPRHRRAPPFLFAHRPVVNRPARSPVSRS